YDPSRFESQFAFTELKTILEKYKNKLRNEAIKNYGISNAELEPFDIFNLPVITTETLSKRGTSNLFALLMLLSALTGPIFIAIDLTSGEKERRTFETLLTLPLTNTDIFLAKTLTALTGATTAVLLSFLSCFVTFAVFPPVAGMQGVPIIDVTANIGITELFQFLIIIMPVVCLASSLSFLIGILSRSYKEANLYYSPFMLVITIFTVIPSLPGFDPKLIYAFIPFANCTISLIEIAKGNIDMAFNSISILSNITFTVIIAIFSIRSLSKEQVIFKKVE
ncbi:MAG: ABC transporter permease, partial [Planctomycetes bacterium]|nr:ABC transporter permease [Planctomycetota bacterium]